MFEKSEIALLAGALALGVAVDVAGGPLTKLVALAVCLTSLWAGYGWLKMSR